MYVDSWHFLEEYLQKVWKVDIYFSQRSIEKYRNKENTPNLALHEMLCISYMHQFLILCFQRVCLLFSEANSFYVVTCKTAFLKKNRRYHKYLTQNGCMYIYTNGKAKFPSVAVFKHIF